MTCFALLRRAALLTLPLALLLVALPAAAEQNGRFELPNAAIWNGPPVLGTEIGLPADSMRAAVDPRSGELRRPSAAEALVLDALSAPVLSRLYAASEVVHADGTVMLALDPELMNYSLARLDAGAAAFVCVDGPTQAAAHLHATENAAPAAEVK